MSLCISRPANEILVLSTKGFPDRHTGINISQEITGIMREYNIRNDQIEAIVHDQGANYELAVNILKQDFGWNELKCSGHCLNSALCEFWALFVSY